MKLFYISTLALALTTTAVIAQTAEDVIKDTTLGVTAIAESLDFTLEGNRDGVTELDVGLSIFDHSYGGVDGVIRFSLGTDLRGSDTLYGRIEYNFGSDVADSLVVYGSAALQYETDTKLKDGLWMLDPSVGIVYGLNDHVGLFTKVGYTWELNQTKRDLGGHVEVGVPFAVTDSLYVTPSVSRTFRTDDNTTAAHLNLTYRF